MSDAYDSLDPRIKTYVDTLLEHAHTALWPERRAALESFYRGIAKADPQELRATAAALDLAPADEAETARMVFQRVLTAYLSRLGVAEVTNPDQAYLYALSLDEEHVEQARHWIAANPDRHA